MTVAFQKAEQLIADVQTARQLMQLARAAAGQALSPLSRTKFIDGGTNTSAASANGSIALPYASISAFLTAIGVPTSASDANQSMIGDLSPSTIAAYTENPAFPAFRNLKLWGTGVVGNIGMLVTGNMTWANSAGGGAVPGGSATLSLHDLSLTGNLTITDDGSVPGTLTLSGDEGRFSNPITGIQGSVIATGATALIRIVMSFAQVNGAVTSTANATGAAIILDGSQLNGAITCKSLTATRTGFASSAITVNSGASITFTQCTFTAATVLTAGAAGTITFDGPSKRSFDEAGGSVASGIVLVVGGYLAAEQTGANYADNAATTNLSLNGTGASAGFTGGGNHYTIPAATLGGNRTAKLLTGGGEAKGDTLLITRNDVTANTFTVQDDTGATLMVMIASKLSFGLFTFNGTHWVNAMPGTN